MQVTASKDPESSAFAAHGSFCVPAEPHVSQLTEPVSGITAQSWSSHAPQLTDSPPRVMQHLGSTAHSPPHPVPQWTEEVSEIVPQSLSDSMLQLATSSSNIVMQSWSSPEPQGTESHSLVRVQSLPSSAPQLTESPAETTEHLPSRPVPHLTESSSGNTARSQISLVFHTTNSSSEITAISQVSPVPQLTESLSGTRAQSLSSAMDQHTIGASDNQAAQQASSTDGGDENDASSDMKAPSSINAEESPTPQLGAAAAPYTDHHSTDVDTNVNAVKESAVDAANGIDMTGIEPGKVRRMPTLLSDVARKGISDSELIADAQTRNQSSVDLARLEQQAGISAVQQSRADVAASQSVGEVVHKTAQSGDWQIVGSKRTWGNSRLITYYSFTSSNSSIPERPGDGKGSLRNRKLSKLQARTRRRQRKRKMKHEEEQQAQS